MAECHGEFKASQWCTHAHGLQKNSEGTLDRVVIGKEKETISKDYNVVCLKSF